jgi:hypothetical protein
LVVADATVWGDWLSENDVGEGAQLKVGVARTVNETLTESGAYVAVWAVDTVMEHCPGAVVKSRTSGDVEANEQPDVSPEPAIA